jgi:uncharacterized protein
MAEAAGVTLGEAVDIAEGGAATPVPRFEARRFAVAGLASQATPVSPGELSVAASVTISYRITPK